MLSPSMNGKETSARLPGEQAARDHYVAAQRDRRGTLARRSRSRQPGLDRVGLSGQQPAGWHKDDGAREILTERLGGQQQTTRSRCG